MPMSPRRFSGKSPDLGQWMVQCPWINKLIKQGGLRLKPVIILLFVAEDETGRHFSLSGRSLCVLKTSFARSWWHICHVPPGLTSSRSQGRDGRDGKDGRDGGGRICSPGGSDFHDFWLGWNGTKSWVFLWYSDCKGVLWILWTGNSENYLSNGSLFHRNQIPSTSFHGLSQPNEHSWIWGPSLWGKAVSLKSTRNWREEFGPLKFLSCLEHPSTCSKVGHAWVWVQNGVYAPIIGWFRLNID